MWIETQKHGLINLNKFVCVRRIFYDGKVELSAYTDPSNYHATSVPIFEGSKEESEAIMEFISKKIDAYNVKDILKFGAEEED